MGTDGMIVYYRGLRRDFYLYPLNELCPGAYYLKIKPYIADVITLYIPGILPLYITRKVFEKEFITP